MNKEKALKCWNDENDFLENEIKNENRHKLLDGNEVIPYFQTIQYYTDKSDEIKEIRFCKNHDGTRLNEKRILKYTAPIAKIRRLEYLNNNERPEINGIIYTILQNNHIDISPNIRISVVQYRDQTDRVSYNGGVYNLIDDYVDPKRDIKVNDSSQNQINISNISDTPHSSQNSIDKNDFSQLTHQQIIEERGKTASSTFIPKMSSIVETMRLEQDEIMRIPENQISFIYGPPGSGKTNIALHRVSYLIDEVYKNKPSRIAFFVFQPVLKSYLQNIIIELDLYNQMQVFTIDKWIKDETEKILKRYNII